MVKEKSFKFTDPNNVSGAQINADGSIYVEPIERQKDNLNECYGLSHYASCPGWDWPSAVKALKELHKKGNSKMKRIRPKKHKKWKKKMAWKTSLPKNGWGTVTLNEDGSICAKASFDPNTSWHTTNKYDAKLKRLRDELTTKLDEVSNAVKVLDSYQKEDFVRFSGTIRKIRAQIDEIKRARKTNR